MRELVYLCLAAAIGEQLTAGNKLRGSIRLITALIAARLMLRIMAALPAALLR
jgi:hypothetical protein